MVVTQIELLVPFVRNHCLVLSMVYLLYRESNHVKAENHLSCSFLWECFSCLNRILYFTLILLFPLARELKIEFLLNRPWRDEMANRTSPEFKLLSGNIADAVSNELVADFNFITSTVLRLR